MRYKALEDSKREMERANEDKIRNMIDAHNVEMLHRKQDYEDKAKVDKKRLEDLCEKTKEEED